MERSENYIKFNYKVKFYTKMFSTRSFENTQPFLFAGYFLPVKVLFLPLSKIVFTIHQPINKMYVC